MAMSSRDLKATMEIGWLNKILCRSYGLAAAGNKSATRPPLPPPECRGEWKETGRNWWVGIRAV